MKLNDTFHFGKFKGLKLIEVYQGALNIDKSLIKKYVEHMFTSDARWAFEGLIGKPIFQVIDSFEVSDSEIRVIGMFAEPWNSNSDERVKLGNIEDLLQRYLSIGNEKIGRIIGGFDSLDVINKQNEVRKPVGANPSYLTWCIENVNNFFIDTEDLEFLENLKIILFKGINVVYKGKEVFEYAPIIEITNYHFTNQLKETNAQKIESIRKSGNFDEVGINYDPNCSQRYLESADWDYDLNNSAHDPSENPWIDILGAGEEAEVAFWNTD
jgi:hypothetical protein